MNKRSLFNLPNGEYELTDKANIYQYILTKRPYKDNDDTLYIIKDKTSGDCLYLDEEYLNEYGNPYSYDGECKYKSFRVSVVIGGLHISSYDSFRIIRELKFKPRGSFKEFVKKTTNNTI